MIMKAEMNCFKIVERTLIFSFVELKSNKARTKRGSRRKIIEKNMVSGLFNYRWSVTLLIPDPLGSTYAVYTLEKALEQAG